MIARILLTAVPLVLLGACQPRGIAPPVASDSAPTLGSSSPHAGGATRDLRQPVHVDGAETAEEHHAFHEPGDRDAWQKPREVIAALGLEGTETVVDIGAGAGYFTFHFARALPGGKVVATEIDPAMVRRIRQRASADGARNVEAVLASPDDPGIPAGADVVFMCHVLHEVAGRGAWLARLVSDMKPGARLVVIEFVEGDLPVGPPASEKLPYGEMVKEVTAAGLTVEREERHVLPYETLTVFAKPPR